MLLAEASGWSYACPVAQSPLSRRARALPVAVRARAARLRFLAGVAFLRVAFAPRVRACLEPRLSAGLGVPGSATAAGTSANTGTAAPLDAEGAATVVPWGGAAARAGGFARAACRPNTCVEPGWAACAAATPAAAGGAGLRRGPVAQYSERPSAKPPTTPRNKRRC